MRPSVAVALAALLLAAPAAASTPTPKTNLPDVEDEVMCPTCGTLLQLAESPQAQDERDFIRRKIAQGETKDQIKDDLVREFGDAVLATPPASGFDLTAYLVPALALLVGLMGIIVGVRRWRRTDRDAGHDDAPLEADETERLDADLARYDL